MSAVQYRHTRLSFISYLGEARYCLRARPTTHSCPLIVRPRKANVGCAAHRVPASTHNMFCLLLLSLRPQWYSEMPPAHGDHASADSHDSTSICIHHGISMSTTPCQISTFHLPKLQCMLMKLFHPRMSSITLRHVCHTLALPLHRAYLTGATCAPYIPLHDAICIVHTLAPCIVRSYHIPRGY